VLIVSGDRHRAEISRIELGRRRVVYDVTSSSLNRPIGARGEKNRYRVGSVYPEANFGLIALDWGARVPSALVSIRSVSGEIVLSQRIALGVESKRLGPLRPYAPRRAAHVKAW
jgi:alkaline phosphatase D